MTTQKLVLKSLLGASALTVFSAGSAFAQTTPAEAAAFTGAGQGIQNTFTLSYDVDGEAQTTITNDADGERTTFTVDRLVDLVVLSSGDNNPVAPGATDEDLVFTVTNLGNDTQAYNLTANDGTNGSDDTFDPTGTDIYFILPGTTTEVLFTGSNFPELEPGEALTVIIRRDIDITQSDGDTAEITLVAETYHATDMEQTDPTTGATTTVANPDAGTEVTANGTNDLDVTENVLVDIAGDDDGPTDGDHSDTGTYIVGSPDLSAEKTVTIFSTDGAGCGAIPGTPATGEQFAVPGACVEYRIVATNAGSVPAEGINIQDILPDNLEFVAVSTDGGFTGGSFTSEPTGGALCDGTATTCDVVFAGGAELDAPTGTATENLGTVIIRALIQ